VTAARREAKRTVPAAAARTAAVLGAVALAAGCGPTASTPVRDVVPTSVAPTTTAPATTAPPTTTLPATVPTTVPTPVAAVPGWSAPATALPPVGGFTSLSCISDVFCLAAGGGSNEADASGSTGPGAVAAWDGATWGTPVTYFAASPGTSPPPWLPAISCTDGPLCAVVDGSGHTSLGDGTNWWPPVALAAVPSPAPDPTDPGPGHPGSRTAAVACLDSQFCAYVDNTGHVATMHGTTWSPPRVFTTPVGSSAVDLFQFGRVAVSCATTTSCTALVGGTELDWDGAAWNRSAAPWGPSAVIGDTAVSCPAPGTCTAVHGSSVSTRTAGSGWSAPQPIDANGGLDAVSCPSTAVCVAADATGHVLRSSGGAWSPPVKVVPTPTAYTGDGTSLSCPSEQFCMVLTGDGDYATYQGVTPPAGTTAVPAASVPGAS